MVMKSEAFQSECLTTILLYHSKNPNLRLFFKSIPVYYVDKIREVRREGNPKKGDPRRLRRAEVDI